MDISPARKNNSLGAEKPRALGEQILRRPRGSPDSGLSEQPTFPSARRGGRSIMRASGHAASRNAVGFVISGVAFGHLDGGSPNGRPRPTTPGAATWRANQTIAGSERPRFQGALVYWIMRSRKTVVQNIRRRSPQQVGWPRGGSRGPRRLIAPLREVRWTTAKGRGRTFAIKADRAPEFLLARGSRPCLRPAVEGELTEDRSGAQIPNALQASSSG